jgi:hypothetical protein
MQVLDYNLQNKGAAVNGSKNELNHPELFAYFFDENCNNLHVCCEQENDSWVNQRDNGTALNVDAAIVARFTSYNKPRA